MSKMSLFRSCASAEPISTITVEELFNMIKTGATKQELSDYWDLLATKNNTASDYKKKKLPAVTYCGEFTQRKQDCLIIPSNIIVIDIDDCPEREALKIKISDDKYTMAVCDSPSVTGLKLFIKMDFGYDAEQYKIMYLNVANYFAKKYEIPIIDKRSKDNLSRWGIDASCSDIGRLLIIPYDENIYINMDSDVFTEFIQLSITEQRVINIINKINEKQVDITPTYSNWFSVGCALNNFLGEAGRKYFHEISKFYSNYSSSEVDKQYSNIVKSGSKGITIATLFSIAKEYGFFSYTNNSEIGTAAAASKLISVEDDDDLKTEFLIPPKEFPVNVFPDEIKDYMTEAQESLLCPIDFIGVAVLATISVAIGNTRAIMAKNGHTEYTNLFLSVVGIPGTKKTPAFEIAIFPIRWLQNISKTNYDSSYKNYLEQEEQYNNLSKKNRGKKPIEPKLEQFFLTDFTIETLSKVLSENPRGVICIFDEITTWLDGMGLYKGGKGNDLSKWLSIWSRTTLKVDRVKGMPIIVRSPFVTLLGGTQPDTIRQRIKNGIDNGFFDRILFVYPEYKNGFSEKPISEIAKKKYFAFIMNLYKYSMPESTEENGDGILTIKLDDAANTLWKEWNLKHLEECEDVFFPYYLRGPWSKMIGHTLRFALIFYCINSFKRATPKYVTADDMRCAFELSDYFKYHAHKIFSFCHDTDIDRKVIEVYTAAKRRNGSITAREVYKNNIGKCKDNKDVTVVFNEMAERKLGIVSFKTPKSGGRKSMIFSIKDTE